MTAHLAPDAIPQPPPWWKRLRAEPPFAIRMALGAALIAVIFFVWWLLTHGPVVERSISPAKLPSPGEVVGSLGKLGDRHLGEAVVDTFERVLFGVGLAAIVGVVLGVLSGANRGVAAAIAPLVIFLRSVPMGALLPQTLLLFGAEEQQKTMFLFLAIVPFVFSDTVKAISLVPDRFIETAQTLGATRFQIVSKVLVPLALPDIVTSIRFQVGLGLGYMMLAEGTDKPGLGQMISVSQRIGPREHVYLLLFIIALIAFAIDLALRTIQRGAFGWRQDL